MSKFHVPKIILHSKYIAKYRQCKKTQKTNDEIREQKICKQKLISLLHFRLCIHLNMLAQKKQKNINQNWQEEFQKSCFWIVND